MTKKNFNSIVFLMIEQYACTLSGHGMSKNTKLAEFFNRANARVELRLSAETIALSAVVVLFYQTDSELLLRWLLVKSEYISCRIAKSRGYLRCVHANWLHNLTSIGNNRVNRVINIINHDVD